MNQDLRLLFVDIDGVFNKSFGMSTNVNVGIIPGDVIDVELTKFIARSIYRKTKNTDFRVIGCSSWFSTVRHEKNEILFKRIRSETGLNIVDVVDDTGGWIGRCRAVLDYVVEHNPTQWCVIDDGDYYHSQNHVGHAFFKNKPYYDIGQHVVKVNGRYGLSNHDIERMFAILGLAEGNYSGAINQTLIRNQFNRFLGTGHLPDEYED